MIELSKGEKVSLTKDKKVNNIFYVGAGWDSYADIDVHVYLQSNSNTRKHLYYANRYAPGVNYSGDNTTGAGDGIDEYMEVNLANISPEIDEIVFAINMFSSGSFAKVKGAFAAVYTNKNNYKKGVCMFNLTEQFDSSIVAVIMGKLIKVDGEWEFVADGTGLSSKLRDTCPVVDKYSNYTVATDQRKKGFFSRIFKK